MLLQDYIINTYKENFHHSYHETDDIILSFFEKEYESNQIKFMESLRIYDENNLSATLFIRLYKLKKTFLWLEKNNICYYSLTDRSILNKLKLDHKASFEELDVQSNIYFLGRILSPDEWVAIDDGFLLETPYVYIKENENAPEKKISIDDLMQITRIKHFQNSVFIPKVIKNLFNSLTVKEFEKINLNPNIHENLTLVNHGEPMNYSVIARNNIHENFSIFYDGQAKDCKLFPNNSLYVMSEKYNEVNKQIYAYAIDAEKYRGFSGFFAHLPKDKHLEKFNIIPGINIATANLESHQITIGDMSLVILKSIESKKIEKDQPIGYSYGQDYFDSRGLIMRFFDVDGHLLPLRLCYPKTFSFRTTHDVLKEMSLESLWNIVKKNKFLLATCEESKKQILLKADELKKLLLQQYAYPLLSDDVINNKNFNAEEAFMKACIEGDFDMVWYLCEFYCEPININLRFKDGSTALHYAVKNRHLDIVRYLLAMGSDIKMINADNKTVLDIAKELVVKDKLPQKKIQRIMEILEVYSIT